MRGVSVDGNGIIGHDPRLRAFDDQNTLPDLDRRRVFLRDGDEIAVLLAHDIFITARVLGGVSDHVSNQTARHRSTKRTQRADGAGSALGTRDAARSRTRRRADGRIRADRNRPDADDNARLHLVGLLNDIARIGVRRIIRRASHQHAGQRKQPKQAGTSPSADYSAQFISPHIELNYMCSSHDGPKLWHLYGTRTHAGSAMRPHTISIARRIKWLTEIPTRNNRRFGFEHPFGSGK